MAKLNALRKMLLSSLSMFLGLGGAMYGHAKEKDTGSMIPTIEQRIADVRERLEARAENQENGLVQDHRDIAQWGNWDNSWCNFNNRTPDDPWWGNSFGGPC